MKPLSTSSTESTEVRLEHVVRKCACQGWIVAEEDDISIGDAVVKHQLDEPHKSWDAESWREHNTTTQPIQTFVRKVA